MSSRAHTDETQQQLSGGSNRILSNEATVDPYAGQYPPPPPLPPEDQAIEQHRQHSYQTHESIETGTTVASASSATTSTHPHNNSNSTQRRSIASSYSSSQNRKSRLSSAIQSSDNVDTEEGHASNRSQHVRTANSSNHSLRQQHASIPIAPVNQRGNYHESSSINDHSINLLAATTMDSSEYYDPEAVDLREYLEAEREEKLRQEARLSEQRLNQQRYSSFHGSVHESEHSPIANRRQNSYFSPHQQIYPPHPGPTAFTSEPTFYSDENYPHPSLHENDFLYNNNSMNHYRPDLPVALISPPPPPNALYMGSPFQQPLHPHSASLGALPAEHAFYNQSTSSFPMTASPLYPHHHQHRYSLPTQPQRSLPSLLQSPPAQRTPIVVPTAPAPTTMFEKILTSSNDRYHLNQEDITTPYSCCCCFRSPVSFCTWIWTLILCILLGTGIALMVVSKVTGDKCGSSDDYRANNDTVCRLLFHDGLLYGGVAVAGISGIVLFYRLIRWCCRPPPAPPSIQHQQF